MKPSPSPKLEDALAQCIQAIQAGADIETALKMYPALVQELRPILQTAQQAQSLSTRSIPSEAMLRSRTRSLGYAAELRKSRKPLLAFLRIPRLASSVVTIFFVGIISLLSLNSVSARALPGDSLYPVKRTFETLWLLNPNTAIQQNLETAYHQRRIEEIETLLAEERQEFVEFEGVLTKVDLLSGVAAEQWEVNGLRVLIMPDTILVGDIHVGMFIAVEGRTEPSMGVVATRVLPKAYSFIGVVKSISSQTWQVDDKAVQIDTMTELDAGIAVGDTVIVLARYDETGQIIARAILRTGADSPDPTSTLVIESPNSPTPSITLTPSPTLTATPRSYRHS
ncbi:MAG: hypothetical protein HC806_00910 [Anaerolineae bacterium]|nr:hypothetical protein [Anaerolineae bacterium]